MGVRFARTATESSLRRAVRGKRTRSKRARAELRRLRKTNPMVYPPEYQRNLRRRVSRRVKSQRLTNADRLRYIEDFEQATGRHRAGWLSNDAILPFALMSLAIVGAVGLAALVGYVAISMIVDRSWMLPA